MRISIIQGVNLDQLGSREPEIYGSQTLEDIHQDLAMIGKREGIEIEPFQSNFEGEIVEKIHSAGKTANGLIINPGAFSHYSYAIRDALSGIRIPKIEVHISNIYAREAFRTLSVTAPACIGVITGLGTRGYEYALLEIKRRLV